MYKFGTKDGIDKSVSADTREARCLLELLENLNNQGDGIRSVWNSEKEKYYFSVVDVIVALTDIGKIATRELAKEHKPYGLK